MSDYEFHGNKEIRLSISVVDDLASSGFQLWADHRFGDEEEAIAVRDALCERFGVPEGAQKSHREAMDLKTALLRCARAKIERLEAKLARIGEVVDSERCKV